MKQQAADTNVNFYDLPIANRIEAAVEQYHQQRSERDQQFRRNNKVIEKSDFTGLFKLDTPQNIVAEIKALVEHFDECLELFQEPVDLYADVNMLVYITENFSRARLIDERHVVLTYGLIDFVLSTMTEDENLPMYRRPYQNRQADSNEIAQMLLQLYLQGNVDKAGNIIKLPDWLVKNLITRITNMAKYNNLAYVDAKALIEFFNGIVE